jgi:hypothetical protein
VAEQYEPTPPNGRTQDPGSASVGQLISEVAGDLSTLMRQEVDLAKAEIRQEAAKAGKAAGLLGTAGFAGYLLVLFASLALMFALGAVMPYGWAALIVAAIWAVVAGVAYMIGRRQLKSVSPAPQQTIETVKEDVQWAKHPTK